MEKNIRKAFCSDTIRVVRDLFRCAGYWMEEGLSYNLEETPPLEDNNEGNVTHQDCKINLMLEENLFTKRNFKP